MRSLAARFRFLVQAGIPAEATNAAPWSPITRETANRTPARGEMREGYRPLESPD